MSVRLIVAVTDGDWFDQLRQKPNLQEVNFWSPSDSPFRALQPGELFLFKLHAPNNFIVGGGVFVHASSMPCSLAWEAFGESNGARSLTEMRARIVSTEERGRTTGMISS
jgi:putative restriction endonuclease